MVNIVLTRNPFLTGVPAFLAFLALFALLWSAVLGLIAGLGGWRALAESYPAPDTPGYDDGAERFSWSSVAFGGGPVSLGNYRSAVTITIGPRGLGLVPNLFFRFRHPPILVPWRAVKVYEEGRTLGLSWVRLEFGNGQRMRVHGRAVPGIIQRVAAAAR